MLVKNPEAGTWLAEVRGVRGLAALPNVSLPTSGAALPGPVDFEVRRLRYELAPVSDIQGHAAQEQIERALKNRMMDTFADNTFRPDAEVTREDFARSLYFNTPLRQTVGSPRRFTDVSPELSAIAEAVTAKGSTLRDYDFKPDGMMSAVASIFNPAGRVTRLDTAVALVRALGLDAEARAHGAMPVTAVYNGIRVPLTDNNEIPAALRGYVQLAVDRGMLQVFFTLDQGPLELTPTLKARVLPGQSVTRAYLAYALDAYRQRFAAGN